MTDYWSMTDADLSDLVAMYRLEGVWRTTGNHDVLNRQETIRQLVARDAALAQQKPDDDPEKPKIGF